MVCYSLGHQESLTQCIETCKNTSCGNMDLKKGCNQMYSCSHACQIRHLGVNQTQCRKECEKRNSGAGNNGCKPQIAGYEFSLCNDCIDHGCSKSRPTVNECETGCASYGKIIALLT